MKEAFKWLNLGEIKPEGWIYSQMKNDLKDGFVGHLDELVPDLIVKDDIYGKNRLSKKIKTKDVGAIAQDADGEVQYLWWNSETQSNWWDGLMRNAVLTDDSDYMKKVKNYIDRILSYQDEDGYLGIYAPDLRFSFDGENGELWAQASLFRVLLGYFEATGEQRILNAVNRAMKLTMAAYPINVSTPFKVKDSYAGLCHGLTITDILEKLYQLTNDKEYLDYAIWLYEDYSKHVVSEDDIQLKNLLNEQYRFKGHGVHTYEHLRALVIAYYASENEVLKTALEQYLKKLDTCLTPSGGPIGDEWVFGNVANSTLTGYEYCSIHELLDSYSLLLQKTGDMKWAHRIEWLLFNAGQGARHPYESSIAYLKTDNSYSMLGVFQEEQKNSNHQVQTRYKYSPTHQDAAVCCVPNAGRLYPYYVKSMWMSNDNGIIATLYGPSKLTTEIKGSTVEIEEKTSYPFNLDISFKISVSNPVDFEISLRKPSWVTTFQLDAEDVDLKETSDMIILSKQWNNNDEIKIHFNTETKVNIDHQGEYYISRGPLVYALPIESEETVGQTFKINNFRELLYVNKEKYPTYLHFTNNIEKSFNFEQGDINTNYPWTTSLYLKGSLYNKETNTLEKVIFVPMGGTILRKVTFPKTII